MAKEGDAPARYRADTLLSVLGRDPAANHGVVNPPVYHASTVLYESTAALEAAMSGLERGRLEARPQDDSAATSAPRIRKSDALVDWSRGARSLERMVRAFDPWPVAFTSAGGEPLRLLRAEAAADASPPLPAPGPCGPAYGTAHR